MPTLEDGLGTVDTLELTGASGVCGALTMGRGPVTERRAFQLSIHVLHGLRSRDHVTFGKRGRDTFSRTLPRTGATT